MSCGCGSVGCNGGGGNNVNTSNALKQLLQGTNGSNPTPVNTQQFPGWR